MVASEGVRGGFSAIYPIVEGDGRSRQVASRVLRRRTGSRPVRRTRGGRSTAGRKGVGSLCATHHGCFAQKTPRPLSSRPRFAAAPNPSRPLHLGRHRSGQRLWCGPALARDCGCGDPPATGRRCTGDSAQGRLLGFLSRTGRHLMTFLPDEPEGIDRPRPVWLRPWHPPPSKSRSCSRRSMVRRHNNPRSRLSSEPGLLQHQKDCFVAEAN